MKNRALLIGLIVLATGIGLGAVLVWRARTPPVVSQSAPFREASPDEQERRRAEAQKLVEDVGEVVQSARRKERKPFRIEASEEQLNTLLQDRLDTSRFPIRDLSLGLQPNNVAVQGTANYNGVEAVATLEGDVVVENGELRYKVNSLKLGGLPAPSKLKGKVETEISQLLERGFRHAPGEIESVMVEEGRMIVGGRTG